jgi:hypothetical protein
MVVYICALTLVILILPLLCSFDLFQFSICQDLACTKQGQWRQGSCSSLNVPFQTFSHTEYYQYLVFPGDTVGSISANFWPKQNFSN